ncbi:MAG TPA: energy transducer TonB [Gammaproteobacteria bacterium]
MVMRYVTAILLALGVTYGLLFIMSQLIASGNEVLTEDDTGIIVDFVRIKQDETVRTKKRDVEKPEKPVPPPAVPKPQIDLAKVNLKTNTGVNFSTNLNISADSLAASDGDYLPIVKVAPVYPRRALSRGIEGYVILEFMVTKLGTVDNIQVVEANPPGYFERAAIKAASRFKYKPKVINGEPVDVAGVRNQITFKIDDNTKAGDD